MTDEDIKKKDENYVNHIKKLVEEINFLQKELILQRS